MRGCLGGGRVGGARRAVRSRGDRRRHRCAPSPRGLGGWHPGHRTQLHTALHPPPPPRCKLPGADRVKAAPPTLLPLGTVSRLSFKAGSCPDHPPPGGSSGVRGFLSSSSLGATAFLPAWGRVPYLYRSPSQRGKARWREICPQRSRQPSINALFSVIRPFHPSLDHFTRGSFE